MSKTGSIVILIIVLAASACTLGTHEEALEPASSVDLPTNTPLPQTVTYATMTPTSTPTISAGSGGETTDQGILPAASDSDSQNTVANLPDDCTVKSDWPVYTVISGDTLAGIARRASSTVDELVTANCLADANLLVVGQKLYVPNALTVYTSTANQTDPTQGVVEIWPSPTVEGSGLVLSVGQTVTLTWPEAPVNQTSQVEFALLSGTGPVPEVTSLGIDTNLADGASIYWVVPSNVSGRLIASARLPGESGGSITSEPMWIYSPIEADSPGVGAVGITPVLRTDGGWYVVQSGATVTLSWLNAPQGANRVDFLLAPTGTGSLPAVIGTDSNPSDGVTLSWPVTSSFTGHLSAIAYMNDGSSVGTAGYTQIYVEQLAPSDGTVMIAPYASFDGTTYTLDRNALVTVTLSGAPTTAAKIEFYYYTEITQVPNFPNTTVLIGTDTNLADGAQVEWHIPGGVEGRVNAIIVQPDGTTTISPDVRVYGEIY